MGAGGSTAGDATPGVEAAVVSATPTAPVASDGSGKDMEFLLASAPACNWLPFAQKAIVPAGDHYDLPKFNGRGHAICLGDAAHALPVVFEPTGDSQSFYIRWADDRELSFEVRLQPGNGHMHCCSSSRAFAPGQPSQDEARR